MPLDAVHAAIAACAFASPEVPLDCARLARLAAAEAERLERVAALHQLRPALAAGLRASGSIDGAAAALRSRLEGIARVNEGDALMKAGELLRVLGALDAAGLRAVPFKGPAFAASSGADARQRETSDLDLLVDPADLLPCARALAPLGFRPPLSESAIASRWLLASTHELKLVRPQDGFLLELHWRLAPPWFPAPVLLGDVLSSLEQRAFSGLAIPWPGATELLLAHISDGMKGGGFGFRWMADVARIARDPAVDWSRVRKLAALNGGIDVVRVAFGAIGRVAAEAGAAPLSNPEARTLAQEALDRRRLRRCVLRIEKRLAEDQRRPPPAALFRWALRVSQRPLDTAIAIARYASGPTAVDLREQPESALRIHARAWVRRACRQAA